MVCPTQRLLSQTRDTDTDYTPNAIIIKSRIVTESLLLRIHLQTNAAFAPVPQRQEDFVDMSESNGITGSGVRETRGWRRNGSSIQYNFGRNQSNDYNNC